MYAKPPVELFPFHDGQLVAWKAEQSAARLRAISVPPANRYVGNERHSLYRELLRAGIGQSTFRSAWVNRTDDARRPARAEDAVGPRCEGARAINLSAR